MKECEGVFNDPAHPTDKCGDCDGFLRDHYWYAGLFVKE